MINEFRDYHRADFISKLSTINTVRASIKGYKPSKTAKLKLECKFIYRHVRDFMKFSFGSNGIPEVTWETWGGIFCEDTNCYCSMQSNITQWRRMVLKMNAKWILIILH